MSLTAPIGAVVGLYVDLVEPVMLGDVIRTGTGRLYQVLDVRVQTRGKATGRQHLRVIVIDEIPPHPTAQVHAIRWYKRDSKRKR